MIFITKYKKSKVFGLLLFVPTLISINSLLIIDDIKIPH